MPAALPASTNSFMRWGIRARRAGSIPAADGSGRSAAARSAAQATRAMPVLFIMWIVSQHECKLLRPQTPCGAVLFEGHTNQLAAGSNSGLDEELLKRRFHR